MAKKLRANGGQAIIEFAFVLPLLCIIVLGIIEFGVLFYDKAVITNASREGARAGIVYRDPDGDGFYNAHPTTDITNAVDNYLNGRLITFGATGPSWTTQVLANEAISPGGRVDVQVTYTHRYLVLPNFLGFGNTINISAETIMRVE
jgi:Flp pilus assembly protein TadG